MAKAFSVASWNVEHFKDDPNRIARVVGFLASQNPDVFALYEVEGKDVFREITKRMPKHTCHITEGPQAQEILVGVRQGFTAFFTQRVEFKSGNSLLRPGALLTVTVAGQPYPVLFLHTKSGNDPKGLGLRDDMLVRACNFKRTLDKVPGSKPPANYLFLGDLNTMGMVYKYVRQEDIEVDNEMLKLRRQASRRKLRLLTKDAPHTWSNGSASTTPPSNLDHVVAADHLRFRQFNGCDVSVRGWPELSGASAQDQWIARFSDHALLYFEVQRA